MRKYLIPIVFFVGSCFASGNRNKKTELNQISTNSNIDDISSENRQIAMVKQQIWENLEKVPGTERDFVTSVELKIANGNTVDAKCKILFPKSSWAIASIVVDDYKDVLKKTNDNIFAVLYNLISDPNIMANEIKVTGLWRPWLGSHVHLEGRGIDIGYVRGEHGSGTIFNYNSSTNENEYGKKIRKSLTANTSKYTQYLSPWFICNPSGNCVVNNGLSNLEKVHRDHLHITVSTL
jgi:hypothetical protein